MDGGHDNASAQAIDSSRVRPGMDRTRDVKKRVRWAFFNNLLDAVEKAPHRRPEAGDVDQEGIVALG